MEIKVLGAGCSRCKKALDVVNKVVGDCGIEVQAGVCHQYHARDGV